MRRQEGWAAGGDREGRVVEVAAVGEEDGVVPVVRAAPEVTVRGSAPTTTTLAQVSALKAQAVRVEPEGTAGKGAMAGAAAVEGMAATAAWPREEGFTSLPEPSP